MKANVKFLNENEYDHWSAFVASCPDGTIYSEPDYLEILCSTVGGNFRILVTEHQGGIIGGIALYEVGRRWGTVVSPRIFLYYNGLVLQQSESKYPSEKTSRELLVQQKLLDSISSCRYASATIKSFGSLCDVRPFLNAGWNAHPTYTYQVDLTNLDVQWNKVDRNLRRLIRRCEGADISISADDDFDSFYEMHLDTHRRKGAPLYLPRDKFKHFCESLIRSRLGTFIHARLPSGKAIASQLVLTGRHEVSHTVAACADNAHLSLGANPYLRWKAFEMLAESGYTVNDLTNASLDSVGHFKSQLGGSLTMNLALTSPASRLHRLATWAESARLTLATKLSATLAAKANGKQT